MTLPEIKDQYAKDKGFFNWWHYRDIHLANRGPVIVETHYQIIHERFLKAKLQEVAEKVDDLKYNSRHQHPFEALVNAKEVILKTPLD